MFSGCGILSVFGDFGVFLGIFGCFWVYAVSWVSLGCCCFGCVVDAVALGLGFSFCGVSALAMFRGFLVCVMLCLVCLVMRVWVISCILGVALFGWAWVLVPCHVLTWVGFGGGLGVFVSLVVGYFCFV